MKRILIVDDDELVRYSLREILADTGYEVTEAENGTLGVDLQNEHQFDLIITDMLMPEKGGLEVIIELKHDFPELKIVAISGGGTTNNLGHVAVAKKYGADYILFKPFPRNEFIWTVNECLSHAP